VRANVEAAVRTEKKKHDDGTTMRMVCALKIEHLRPGLFGRWQGDQLYREVT